MQNSSHSMQRHSMQMMSFFVVVCLFVQRVLHRSKGAFKFGTFSSYISKNGLLNDCRTMCSESEHAVLSC